MESSSNFYNKGAHRDYNDDPYEKEDIISSYRKMPEMLKPSLSPEEAKKANESIFNRAPSIKPEQNSILKRLGDDANHDIGKSNEYFVKIKALEYLSSFLTIANIWN